MDDEIDTKYQEYKFAFEELEEVDDKPITRIPTAQLFWQLKDFKNIKH